MLRNKIYILSSYFLISFIFAEGLIDPIGLNKLHDNVYRLARFYLITAYWFAYTNYYHNDRFGDEINNCLDDIDQEKVLLSSPHFCKKVYHYLMRPESVK